MYANPRDKDLEYFFLEHGDGTPLASFGYTGYTASRVKKLMRSESMAYAEGERIEVEQEEQLAHSRGEGRDWNHRARPCANALRIAPLLFRRHSAGTRHHFL